ncbi:nuclear transcription factor Y subunit C-4-like [Zingiber officinale]|uniref:nuclear transcription factor Y subunit C-4-like n=1 Tax=Zingiber officinale TaxID=94328 RepID=UPI001C4D01FE|nr:nuclear transcription factor Y subunit C-4-like [Zingiber officinale]XP_042463946.1 nuclear transcription factor Y subunit C-4-like [Zingiber officinale]XP_042463947.1 nuclear transcription factor Y subunit C-4-like [Zingiber officinale]XP_042463948.1 nuclear transcription factor Y subunit C-4-like [Zingiber officinale]XP_042463949.1 nuclear transcription factor Y subunit C-4-like [Zingiber officinale]XP_042463950.1 nuclear transcription factor Y subunit C-4-like [Zingiber officinale]XP_04
MEQSTQSTHPTVGVVSGAAQIAYAAPMYQPAAVATGPPPMTGGAIPAIAQLTSEYPTNPANLASQHQLAYQQVQQFHHHQQQLQAFWANQMLEIEQTNDYKNHSLPLARIKKIMKADEDVRMISAEAPVVFAKACEMFILELTLRSWIHTEENKRRTLQKNDIAAAITRTDIFDFLVDIVPRDELKDDNFGMARAGALPAVGAPNDSVPYYYVPAAQIPGDQTTAATLYAVPQPHLAYMWQQPQLQPPPHHQQASDDV